MRRLRQLFFVFVLSAAAMVAVAQPEPGMMAKEIQLPGVTHQTISLSSLKGKVVLIDFWASWCRPCRQTVPGLKKLYSEYHDRGFEIYGISLDESEKAWKNAIEEDQSKWIHVNDKTGQIANQWVVSVIPTSFLIDKSGKVVAVDEDSKSLGKLISQLL